MSEWPLKDAEFRFADLLAACLKDGPQTVTEHGTAAAVLVPADEWRRLTVTGRPSLKTLLLDRTPQVDIPIPRRGGLHRRDPKTAT